MRRPFVAVLACLSLGLLSGETLPQHPTPEDGTSLQAAAPPSAELSRGNRAVALAVEEFESRHSGLSRREVLRIAEVVVQESERHGIDPSLVMAVILVESGGYNFAVSSVGALGLMQVMPATGEQLAAEMQISWLGPETLFDPVVNVKLGVAYLRQLSDRYGSWPTALAAYNWGPARIDSRIRRGAAVPSVYARQVMKLYDAGGEQS
jgi:soluble lytic murein transglycosylase